MNQQSRHLFHILLWHGTKVEERNLVLLAVLNLTQIFNPLVCSTFKHTDYNCFCLLSFSSSAVLEGPGFCDKKPWKSVDFSHGEFISEHPKETCKLVTEMSIDFPAAIGTNDRNVTNGSDICTSSELSWLHQVEPLPNSSNGLARNSIKTFSNKGKKLVTYRRSRVQGKWIKIHLWPCCIRDHTEQLPIST